MSASSRLQAFIKTYNNGFLKGKVKKVSEIECKFTR